MTRTVADAALMLNACAGPDERDPFSLPAPRLDYVKALERRAQGPAGGVGRRPRLRQGGGPGGGGGRARRGARFRELGAAWRRSRRSWPSPQEAWEDHLLRRHRGAPGPALRERRDDIDPGLLAIIERRGWSPTRYVQAWFDRLAWDDHPRGLFEHYDLLLTPTIASAAFKVGLDNPTEIAGRRPGSTTGSRSRTRST